MQMQHFHFPDFTHEIRAPPVSFIKQGGGGEGGGAEECLEVRCACINRLDSVLSSSG